MIGFVSALSSSLAIIILIMSVMMLNMIISAQSEQESNNEITILENEKGAGEESEEEKKKREEKEKKEDGGSLVELRNNIVSSYDISRLSKIQGVKKFIIYCEYGYSFDYNSAMKLTAFNTIAVSKKFPDVEIQVLKPIQQESENNICVVKYEK